MIITDDKYKIECNNLCNTCPFNWRNAANNPDCFLDEIADWKKEELK